MTKFSELFRQFEQAVQRLDEVLTMERTTVVRDSAIQRFEISFELAWKIVKEFLGEYKGIVCRSPKGCFKEMYKQGLISYDHNWMQMTDMRNYTTHAYDEKLADNIYDQLPKVLQSFQELIAAIDREVKKDEI